MFDRRTAKELRAENELLRQIAANLHFHARRYADGRQTWVPREVNEHARALVRMGVGLQGDPAYGGTVWARNPLGREYDGLTDDEAAVGESDG